MGGAQTAAVGSFAQAKGGTYLQRKVVVWGSFGGGVPARCLVPSKAGCACTVRALCENKAILDPFPPMAKVTAITTAFPCAGLLRFLCSPKTHIKLWFTRIAVCTLCRDAPKMRGGGFVGLRADP